MDKQPEFYLICQGDMIICDPECCAPSNRSFDIEVKKLAGDEALLDRLNLFSSFAKNEQRTWGRVDYIDGFRWFCGYLSAFGNSKGSYEYLLTYPVVRVLIMSDERMARLNEFKNFPWAQQNSIGITG